MLSLLLQSLLVLAITVVDASPTLLERTFPAPSCNYKSFLDTFDDRKALPVAVSPVSAVGTYGAFNYKTFNVVDSLGTPLVAPPSKPNYIFAGLIGQVTTGQPQFLPATDKVKYFDLQNIAYACTANSNAKAVSCTIQIAAVKKDTKETVVQELVYDPKLLPSITDVVTGQLASPFAQTSFPASKFTGLTAVTISIISSAVTSGLTNVLFDNVGYKACISG